MTVVELSLVLMLLLFAILGSGVWIALALAVCGFVAILTKVSTPAGQVLATSMWAASNSWDLTALPMFIWMGEILYRTKLSEDMFAGLAPWLQTSARPAAARERGRLRDLRRGVGLVGRDLRHHRPHRVARTPQARLRREDGDRHARRLRHARPVDPALDHHDRLRHRHRPIDRAPVHRRRRARHHAGGIVHGLHRGLGAAQQATACRRPSRTCRSSRASRRRAG